MGGANSLIAELMRWVDYSIKYYITIINMYLIYVSPAICELGGGRLSGDDYVYKTTGPPLNK